MLEIFESMFDKIRAGKGIPYQYEEAVLGPDEVEISSPSGGGGEGEEEVQEGGDGQVHVVE